MACDINTLLNEAKCFSCLDEKSQLAVIATLLCDISAAGGGGGIGTPFIADNLNPAAGVIFSGPHGLGQVPTIFRAVTKAIAVDANVGAPIGTEIDIFSWFDNSSTANEFALMADATNITLISNFFTHGPGESDCIVLSPLGGIGSPADVRNFKLKIYAWK